MTFLLQEKCVVFLSYSANLGCSRCYEAFSRGFGKRNCYDNFDRDKWIMRSNERHRSDVSEILKCKTKTRKEKKESEVGCRYSVLLDLPYVNMLLIDPMHNLFFGTAKHFAWKLWIGSNILGSVELSKIEDKLKNFTVPTGLGRIPVSINTGNFLTAEQWKSWTLYFSVYCLVDLLPKPRLECWRHFVLACRRLCKFSITNDDITIADVLLLRFCKRSVQLYGSEAITPNMHMHCHLTNCIREFGPFHSFWLFPFERYNGILEGQPSNNRSIEIQLMRRFQNDTSHLHLYHEMKKWPNAELFLKAFPEPNYDTANIPNFGTSISVGPVAKIGVFSDDSLICMNNLYSELLSCLQSAISWEYHPLSRSILVYCGKINT